MAKRGRPKGSKNKATVDKELLREELRALVRADLEPLVSAQIASAKGIRYLVAREKKSGKFVEVTQAQVKAILAGKNDTLEALEVWEKQPSTPAFTDLMNRTIDKPAEQLQADVSHSGTLTFKWASE